MKLIIAYLKDHKKTILIFAVWILIFFLVFFLSSIPAEAVLYAGFLCFLVGIFAAGYDFYHYRKQHKELQLLMESIDAQIDHLPEPRNLLHNDYTEMICELHRQKRVAESKAYIENKDLTDYFTSWAHQIKTPISAMGLILQSKGAWAGEDDKELGFELFHVEEYVNMAMSYIRAMDLSGDLAFEKISLDAVIRQVVKKYSRLFFSGNISLDFQETGYTAVTDEKWLATALGQILSNSLKYTPAGGRISIWMEGDLLKIKDTGIGIPAEDLPRIFEKGFTGGNGREHTKSTGQGLYLVKTIMDKLSHGIEATSKEGEGTTVTLDFYRETFQ